MRSLKSYGATNDKKDKLKALGVDEEKAKKYTSMSEDELIGELLSSVRKQKADGTFDKKQLQMLSSVLAPQLDEAQREKLNDLVRLLCATD